MPTHPSHSVALLSALALVHAAAAQTPATPDSPTPSADTAPVHAPATDHTHSDRNSPRLPDPDAPKPWTVQIEPMVWFAAPSGKVQLPINSGDGPGSFTTRGDRVEMNALNLDSSRLTPTGELHINADDFRFTFAGFLFENDDNTVTASEDFRLGAVDVAAGDLFAVDFDLGIYELSIGYKLCDRDFRAESERPEDALPIVLKFYALAGARLYDLSFDFRRMGGAGPAQAAYDDMFVEPFLGGRGELEITRTFGVDLLVSFGYLPGDQSTLSIDVAAGFHWRPLENLGIQVGYRQLAFDLEDGDDAEAFRYDGRLAGLFAGIVLRF